VRDLLFLSHRIPYPPDKGDKIRAWHIFQHLARSWRVHLGCLIDDPADWAHVPRLRPLCADLACFGRHPSWRRLRALAHLRPGRPLTLDYFQDPGLQRWVDTTLARGEIAAVFVFCSAMAPYVMRPGVIGSGAMGSGRVACMLDMVDVDSAKWAAYAQQRRWPMRPVWAREARTLLAFERQAARHFDRTLFVSADECRHFASLAPESRDRLDWVENGVDLERFSPRLAFATPFPGDAPAIVFTGRMDYWPNESGALWFAREVMPRLRRGRHPPQFHIVGADPGPPLRRLAGEPDIHVTGRVADTRPYLAHAAAVVAPLGVARGIQNKVLEAMAMGRPVVASTQAFEGVRAQPGRDLLVAADAEAMARLVSEVLEGRHPGLGAAAREAVERGHDWTATLRRLDPLLGATTPSSAAGSARLAPPVRVAP
jgi:sugar transferase (PEP-CTERM/EpsH1 system associated)